MPSCRARCSTPSRPVVATAIGRTWWRTRWAIAGASSPGASSETSATCAWPAAALARRSVTSMQRLRTTMPGRDESADSAVDSHGAPGSDDQDAGAAVVHASALPDDRDAVVLGGGQCQPDPWVVAVADTRPGPGGCRSGLNDSPRVARRSPRRRRGPAGVEPPGSGHPDVDGRAGGDAGRDSLAGAQIGTSSRSSSAHRARRPAPARRHRPPGRAWRRRGSRHPPEIALGVGAGRRTEPAAPRGRGRSAAGPRPGRLPRPRPRSCCRLPRSASPRPGRTWPRGRHRSRAGGRASRAGRRAPRREHLSPEISAHGAHH